MQGGPNIWHTRNYSSFHQIKVIDPIHLIPVTHDLSPNSLLFFFVSGRSVGFGTRDQQGLKPSIGIVSV